MSSWFIVHSPESYEECDFAIAFNETTRNARNISVGDLIVYYVSGRQQIRGLFKVTELAERPNRIFEHWNEHYQFRIIRVISIEDPIDFRPFITQISFLQDLGNNWGQAIQGVNSIRRLTREDFDLLLKSIAINEIHDLIAENRVFENSLLDSLTDAHEERLRRLIDAPQRPEKKITTSYVYDRNPDVVAERLYQADGICEHCANIAPFLRRTDGTPYLEVHHIIALSEDGEDTVENTIALCPNCHRGMHFG